MYEVLLRKPARYGQAKYGQEKYGGATYTDVTSQGTVEGLEIRRGSRESISTAQLVFAQDQAATGKLAVREWREWTEVVIRDAATEARRFGGYITELERRHVGPGRYKVQATLSDYGVLLDRIVVSRSWTDSTDRTIVQDLAAAASGLGLSASNSTVAFFATLGEFEAKDLTVREALERLCELTGGRWHIDYDRVLHYYQPGVRAAPFGFSDTPDGSASFGYQMRSFRRTFASGANRITLLGGLGEGGEELRVTRENSASIRAFGVLQAVKVDRQIGSTAIAQLTLDAELAERAQPQVTGTAVTRRAGLELGQTVPVKSSIYGVDGSYVIHGIRERISGRSVEYEIEFGERLADVVTALRRISREDRDVPVAVPARGSVGGDAIASVPVEKLVGMIDAEIIGGVLAQRILGTLQAHQISAVAAETVQGLLQAQQIGSIYAETVQGVFVSDQFANGILDSLRLMSSELQVVERLGPNQALPSLPSVDYPEGSLVLRSARYGAGRSKYGQAKYGSWLYEQRGGVWVRTTAASTLTGTLRFSDIESIQAQQIIGLIVAAQIQSLRTDQLIGQLAATQIANVFVERLIGQLVATQILTVNATSIQGVLASTQIGAINAQTVTLLGQWNDSHIVSVNASKLLAGTVAATIRMTSPDIEVSGGNYNLRLQNTTGLRITATGGVTRTMRVDAGELYIDGVGTAYASLREGNLVVQYTTSIGAALQATASGAVLLLGSAATNWTMIAGLSASLTSGSNGASIALTGAGSSLSAKQLRLPIVVGNVSIPATVTKYFEIYNENGNLIGKVPII